MHIRRPLAGLSAGLAVLSILAACTSQASPAGSASPAASLSAPSPSGSSPAPSAADPSADASPSPTPRPSPVAWSAPTAVSSLKGCISVVATIDDRGTDHLAADCPNGIRYASSIDGTTWKATTWKPPANRQLSEPQIAFDGDTLTVAYSRLAPVEGGCGDDGLSDVGVYTRTRTLPDGSWSNEQKIGSTADHLQALRTSGGIQAIVDNEKDGKTYYETIANGATKRYPVDGSGVSLRIGDDGKARIAYEGADGIRYGVFNGSGFDSSAVPGSGGGFAPVLVLGPGNTPYLIWTKTYHGGGCAEPGPQPDDGTYWATNSGGTWTSAELTPRLGGASLVVDANGTDLHALVADQQSLVYFTKPAGGDWTEKTLLTGDISSPVLRQDAATGNLFAAFVSGATEDETGVTVMTRR